MTKLYLIRHGESQANLSRSFAGSYNIDLTEKGKEQAERVPLYFVDKQVDCIFSSDLLRAYNTALPLAKERGIDIIKCRALREISAGQWEARTFAEIMEKYAEDYDVWLHDIGKARCTGGESSAELGARVYAAIARIVRENEGKTVVITTHATPIRAMVALLKTGSVDGMKDFPWVPNASVTEITYADGMFTLDGIGCTDHLDGLLTKLPTNV